jgi:prevent-host-death family protein
MRHVGSYQAKTHLPALLDAVARGETVVITRRGRPAARLTPVPGGTAGGHDAVAAVRAFGARHRGRLRGMSARSLLEDGRR